MVVVGWFAPGVLSSAHDELDAERNKEPDAQGGLHAQARAGRQPGRTAQAEAPGRGVRDPAREAAAGQGRDGRAALRHQPGRPRPRPPVRALQARPGRDQGLLRRVADRDPGHRSLSRHRRFRGRHRQPVAHRDLAQPQHQHRQGPLRRAVDGIDGAHLPLPRPDRDRRDATDRRGGEVQSREPRNDAQHHERRPLAGA